MNTSTVLTICIHKNVGVLYAAMYIRILCLKDKEKAIKFWHALKIPVSSW